MLPRKQTVTVTTGVSSGAGTGYTGVISGRILSIRYAKTDYTDGVVLAVTLESSGETVLAKATGTMNASFLARPRTLVQKNIDGTDLTTYEPTHCAEDRVLFSVSSAGNSKTGTFIVVYG